MTGPDARVRDLVAGGRITVEEGERLRLALRGTGGVPRIVRNPVEYLRPLHATLLAVAVVAASLAVSQLGVRFDGAFDMHRVAGVPSWRTALVDQAVAVPLTACILWITSLVVRRQGRVQDFLVAVAVSRLPLVLVALWALVMLPAPAELMRQAVSGQVSIRVMIGAVSSLPFTVWKFVWLYRGFAMSAGMRGPRAGISFVVAVVVAEVLSKVALTALLR